MGHKLRNAHSRKLELNYSHVKGNYIGGVTSQGALAFVDGSPKFKGGTRLDGYNDKLEGKFLHATKGFRYPATKSGVAGIVMGYIKQGLVHPIDLPRIRQEFTNLGHKMSRKDLVYLEVTNG